VIVRFVDIDGIVVALNIQVLVWDRHKDESQPYPLDNWNSNIFRK
jgi:hypothetical protein